MPDYKLNILRIRAVAEALGDLLPQVAFVGGATVALYLENQSKEQSRPTDDVDIVVELAGGPAYALLEEKLRSRGFQPDATSDVMCRYRIQGIIVDVMPMDESILGFSNRWYKIGLAKTENVVLGEVTIRVFSPDIFLASKFEALQSRGGSDYRMSTDMEDICCLLAYGKSELKASLPALTLYLQTQALRLLSRPNLEEEIESHLDPSIASDSLAKALKRLSALAEI